MRLSVLGLFLGLALLPSPSSAGDPPAKERTNMAGTWKFAAYEVDGNKPLTKDDLANLVLTIDRDGKMTVQQNGKTIAKYTSEIDPTKTPKTMDQTFTIGEGKGRTSLAIYELKGDTLECCYAPRGGARPTEFSSKGGTLVVYERTKGK